jgi:hypothetical protein
MRYVSFWLLAIGIFACAKNSGLVKTTGDLEKKEAVASDSTRYISKEMFVNVADGLNVRSRPGKSAKKIATLRRGERVKILADEGEAIVIDGVTGKWTQISAGKVTGWCFGGFLSEKQPKDLQPPLEDNPMFNPNTNFQEYNQNRVQKCLDQCGGDSSCKRNCGDW